MHYWEIETETSSDQNSEGLKLRLGFVAQKSRKNYGNISWFIRPWNPGRADGSPLGLLGIYFGAVKFLIEACLIHWCVYIAHITCVSLQKIVIRVNETTGWERIFDA